jgi:hypothetical protein
MILEMMSYHYNKKLVTIVKGTHKVTSILLKVHGAAMGVGCGGVLTLVGWTLLHMWILKLVLGIASAFGLIVGVETVP